MTSANAGGLVGQTLGEYTIDAHIGTGGMAEVYRGRDPKLGRDVAVKVLPPHFATDSGYVSRFRDEARAVGAIDHPNIVPVYQFGEERGLLYIVMPLLKQSLRERMENSGLPPIADAARIAVQVAAALDAAHHHGIVHRDVKPENILLNNEGRALLTDFGIAREAALLRDPHAARTLSASGLPVGTPEYMAPEQLRREKVDQRADIYALGAVLYEMLTGHAPHEAASVYEVAAAALTAPVTPPSELNPSVWPELEKVVMTALAKDADERYPDARSFALALRSAMQNRSEGRMARLTVPAYQAMENGQLSASVLNLIPQSGPLTPGSSAKEKPPLAAAPTTTPLYEDEGDGGVPLPYGPRSTGHPVPERRKGRVALLALAASLLLIVGLVAGGAMVVMNGFGVRTIYLPGGDSISIGIGGTATSNATNTAGTTPSATGAGTPGATAGPGTPTTSAAATPTFTVGAGTPTATRILPTATATSTPPPNLLLGPSPVKLTCCQWTGSTGVWAGTQTITNTGTAPRQWTLSGLPANWWWNLDGNGWVSVSGSGQPSGGSLAASGKDNLAFGAPNKHLTVTVTVTDDLGRSQTFTLQS